MLDMSTGIEDMRHLNVEQFYLYYTDTKC